MPQVYLNLMSQFVYIFIYKILFFVNFDGKMLI